MLRRAGAFWPPLAWGVLMVALTVRGWVLLRGSMPPFCTNLEGGRA